MQKKCTRKLSSFLLCMVLMVAMALFSGGCGSKTGNGNSSAQTDTGGQAEVKELTVADGQTELGEGLTQFTFNVVDKDGNETQFIIHTDKETVGEALLELELIAGDESEYGLYVKTVNGITADYDTDGTYWAFYIGDEYAVTGVDATAVTEGAAYAFKVE